MDGSGIGACHPGIGVATNIAVAEKRLWRVNTSDPGPASYRCYQFASRGSWHSGPSRSYPRGPVECRTTRLDQVSWRITITKMMTTRTPMIVPIRPLFMTSSLGNWSQTRTGTYATCTPQRVVFEHRPTPCRRRRRAMPVTPGGFEQSTSLAADVPPRESPQ